MVSLDEFLKAGKVREFFIWSFIRMSCSDIYFCEQLFYKPIDTFLKKVDSPYHQMIAL